MLAWNASPLQGGFAAVPNLIFQWMYIPLNTVYFVWQFLNAWMSPNIEELEYTHYFLQIHLAIQANSQIINNELNNVLFKGLMGIWNLERKYNIWYSASLWNSIEKYPDIPLEKVVFSQVLKSIEETNCKGELWKWC